MTSLELRSVEFSDGVIVLVLEGELDGRTAPQLEQVVMRYIEGGHSRIAVDLDRLSTLTSAGAGVFIGALVHAQERGGDLSLVRPRPQVRQVLEMLGLDRILRIPVSLDEAAAGLRTPDAPAPARVSGQGMHESWVLRR